MSLHAPRNIRTRVALWSVTVFGGILIAYAAATSWFFLSMLDRHLDDSLKEDLELVDQMLVHAPREFLAADGHEGEFHRLERFLEIWSPIGRLLYRSPSLAGRSLGPHPDPIEGTVRFLSRSAQLEDGTHVRIASLMHTAGGDPRIIRLGVSEEAYFAETREFLRILFFAIPLALLLVTAGGYSLARRTLRPVDRMVAAAQHIGAQDLRQRLPVGDADDEIGRLASAFNELLARLETAFDQLRRFTADASHELRTPLSAMKSVGEVGLQGTRTPGEYREIIGSMLEEANRLTRLVESLLVLARADAAAVAHRLEALDLSAVAHAAADLTGILAEENGQRLVVSAREPVPARADRTLLNQALLNLIDNAVKFSPSGTVVTVETGTDAGGRPFLRVMDQGPGISEEEQELVFRRFYRSPAARGRYPGSGLGLAISKWAAEAQGGTLTVESRVGTGSSFRITLPQP